MVCRAMRIVRRVAWGALIGLWVTDSRLQAQAAPAPLPPPAAQNPSPMAERTRAHERLTEQSLAGALRSLAGPAGKVVSLRVPPRTARNHRLDLVVHFHGAAWLPHQATAALKRPTASAVLNLGAGSGVYDRSFRDPLAFDTLLASITRELTDATGAPVELDRITLVGFSAGHGAIRQILREPQHFARVNAVLLLDGMHTSYVPEGRVLADGGVLDTTNLTAFAAFARAAAQGQKRFLVTHSEIFPGTFASTTETADWLVSRVPVRRVPVLRWGPRGLQQLSEARRGRLLLRGYAGNSAPDHIDQFHAMPELLRQLWR